MPEAIRQGDIPGVQARVRVALPGPPEVVWVWIEDPERWPRWLADEAWAEADGVWRLRTGARGGQEAGEAFDERLSRVEAVPVERWVASVERVGRGWRTATRLTVDLAPAAGGSELSIFQEGFQHLPLSIGLSEWEAYRHRWRDAADRLAGLDLQGL